MVWIAATFAAAIAGTTIAGAAIATTTTAAATTAIPARTAITAIATRFARFAWRARVFQFLASFLVDDPHRQANLAALVDLEHLDLHCLTFG